MPFYQNLNGKKREEKRIIQNLLKLRKGFDLEEIPKRTLEETLLLATWNIRDFDKKSYGKRLKESYYYIAEIIARFDMVAIQEVYRDMTALKEVMKILGSDWDYIFTDATEGRQGNDERMAFLFDKRKIRFGGLAGELVIPQIKDKNGKYKSTQQVWRTPMICGFRSGWAKFMLCSVHVQWGKSSANSPSRVKEIRQIAEFLKARTEDKTAWARKLILLGDFNIFNNKDKTYKALLDNGFHSPEILDTTYTNVAKQKRQYDKILVRDVKDSLKVVNGGTFDFFKYVFRNDESDYYKNHPKHMIKEGVKEKYKQYHSWRTHQISDHKPVWLEMQIDFSEEYLANKLTAK